MVKVIEISGEDLEKMLENSPDKLESRSGACNCERCVQQRKEFH